MFDTTEPVHPEPLMVSVKMAGHMLSLGKTKLFELCKDGQLDRRHVGRKAVITVASIRAYVERLAG
jgi:hypothetical protein